MYSQVEISTHLFIRKEEMRLDVESAKQKFTAVSKYDSDAKFPMYLDLPRVFGVPLYYYSDWKRIAKKVVDLRNDGSKINFEFTSKLRPGQDELIKEFQVNLVSGKTGYRIEAPPGFGKTVVILKMLEILKRSALVIVPRANLVDQWVERIAGHTTFASSDIGVINGKVTEWQGKPITVALVHSVAAQMVNVFTFHNNFGVAVFDEVDRSVPPSTFSPVLSLFPVKYRIGASATVKRKDGLHLVSDSHIAQVRLKGGDVGRMKPKILVVNYAGDSGKVWRGGSKLNRRGILLSKLAENSLRNQFLCKYIELIVKSGRRLLVLSDRTAQLKALYDIMSRRGIKLKDMGFYCDSIALGKNKNKKHKVSKMELEAVASDCKIIFGTYGKIAIGTDIQDLAGLVYGTPQSDVRQTQGRIERMLAGKMQPVVVDIVDTLYDDTVAWSRARRRYYFQKGLTVKVN